MAVTIEKIALAAGVDTPDPTSPTAKQWEMWIDDALMLIEDKLGDLTKLNQAKLDYVVREAVAAHAKRPDDATQVSISVDDGQSSRTYRSGKGRVVILDEWWALLSPSTKSGAWSILPSGGRTVEHAETCNLRMGGTYCSCGGDIAGFPIYEAP